MKAHKSLSILCAILLWGAVLVLPAYADLENVDEEELARTNVSLSGAPVNDQTIAVEKDLVRPETEHDAVDIDNGSNTFNPADPATGMVGLNLNIAGQETFKYYFGGASANSTVNIQSVTPH